MTAGSPTMPASVRPDPGAPDDQPGVADEALVVRLRAGELPAGKTLAERYFTPLMRYLHRLVGADGADELYQQTWLSVLEHLDRFDPNPAGGGFKAWLFRIATNKAHDHWRSRGREKAAKEGLKRITDEQLPHAGFRLEGTEEDIKLRKAIEQLPQNQREVLLLRYYSGMKFVDIAKQLGCPLNTALGRVHKALIKLRALMENE